MDTRLQVVDLRFLDWEPLRLAVADGECVGISGASGSGKSLLLRAIVDLDPHEGEVLLDGRARSSIPAPEWRRRVGMLPAESRWWSDRVGDHFPRNMDPAMLVALGFEGEQVLGWPVDRLSVGERQRLALARLLARGPQVLLLDEPTANLDAEATARVERLVAGTGCPTIWVGHDPTQLRRVAGRHFRMADKRLTEDSAWA